jgi:transcriptional regulator GlxA family with amidase domain
MTQIAIVLYPGYTALDFIGPYEVLRNLPDAEVRFLWHQPGPIAADSGVLIIGATHTFEETPEPDVILVPGGMTTMEHARDQKLLDWLRQAHQSAPWTTSVCSGSVILAAAGLLEGRCATSHWAAVSSLKAFGAIPVGDERIVVEGKPGKRIVTSAGVSAGIDLAIWLTAQIAGEARAKAVQLVIEYDPQPPFDSGHMSKASAATKAAATTILSKDLLKPAQLKATTLLMWEQALRAARSKRRRGRRSDARALTRA